MLITIINLFLATILLILSLLHGYWATGGRWGFEAALPTNEKGEKIINPGKVDCSIVCTGLLLFSAYYSIRLLDLQQLLPVWLYQFLGYAIPLFFMARAIGDFKYIGFFKNIIDTPFAKRDSALYSPLCLLIGTFGFGLQTFN